MSQTQPNPVGNLSDLSGRTVILSDVHLSFKPVWREELEALRGLWQGAQTVIFNGDTVDYGLYLRQGVHCDVFEYIERICREDNVEPVVLAGNSDIGFAQKRHTFLADNRVVVFHGDVLFDNISPWRKTASKLKRFRREATEAMGPGKIATFEGQLLSVSQAIEQGRRAARLKRKKRGADVDSSDRFLSWWWLWHPHKAIDVIKAWVSMPRLTAKFVRRFVPQAKYAIVGHVHRGGCWCINGITIINTGSFCGPFGPMFAEMQNGELFLRRADKIDSVYRPGHIVRRVTLDAK